MRIAKAALLFDETDDAADLKGAVDSGVIRVRCPLEQLVVVQLVEDVLLPG